MRQAVNDVAVVLFDWGGTLCSTRTQAARFLQCANAACAVAEAVGIRLNGGAAERLLDLFIPVHIRPEPADQNPEMRIEPVLARWLADEGTDPVPGPCLYDIGRAFWQAWVGSLQLIDRADEVVAELRRRGYRLGLVSNVASPPDICLQELDRLNLRPLFEAFAFSSQVGRRKPHLAIYQSAVDQINRNGRSVRLDRMLFVGDSPECDVQAPAALGMKTALLPDTAGIWDTAHHACVQPDLRIHSLADLLNVLTGSSPGPRQIL